MIGILLGLSAGLAPGPILMLVISESLKHGVRSGMEVALAPVITDLPIILLTLFFISKLSGFQSGLGMVSLVGGAFILYTGFTAICTKAVEVTVSNEPSKSLLKGCVANLLSPHPYLFWIGIGAPTVSRSLNIGVSAAVLFIAGFYVSLVGSKILLAMVVGKSRTFLTGNLYLYTLRFLGLLLSAFSIILFRDGAKLLGLI